MTDRIHLVSLAPAARERPGLGFVARGVAAYLEREGLARPIELAVPMELPPVGLIGLRGRSRTPACAQLVEALRKEARPPRSKRVGSANGSKRRQAA